MTREALAQRIERFIDGSLQGDAPEPWDDLAADVHRHQREHAPVVAALSEDGGGIPAVPVRLFKDLRVSTVPPGQAPVCFRTSGTTGGGRGEHVMRDTRLYDRGALGWAQRCVGPLPGRIVAMLEDPVDSPDSSLSHMVGLFGDHRTWHVHRGTLDPEGVDRALDAAVPVFLACTAFAAAEWVMRRPVIHLPAASTVMVTGGFKGRVHHLDGESLYAALRVALPGARIVTEYGMTELSSQLWGTPTTPYRPPPWMRVVAVDPETGNPRSAGEPGQLQFFDLCNLDSTLGVETLDQGVVDAEGAVTLHGRLAGAPVRGCSLTIEEGW